MTLSEHMARGLFVAWSFLIGDKSQLKFLEMSEQSAVRSFAALSFAAPLFFLINWLQFRTAGFEWVNIIHIAALFIGYAIAWVVFAGMIRFAFSVVGPEKNYYIYLPLYNWARVYVLLLALPFFILISFDVVAGYAKDAAALATLVVIFGYKYRITRATLLMPVAHSVLFVLFDMVFVTLVDAVVFSAVRIFQ